MIKLRARPDHYRMRLKIHFKVDCQILNYEYERENFITSDDEFSSKESKDTSDKDDGDSELVLTLHILAPVTPAEDEEGLLDENLQQLNRAFAEKVKQVIQNHPRVIASSFADSRPSKVSLKHSFESTFNNSIKQKARRVPAVL